MEDEGGNVTLSWAFSQTGAAVSRDIYFGADRHAVKAATRSSSAYLGNQAGNSRVVPVADPGATYYWRIDEIDTLGNVVAGPVWSFRLGQGALPGPEVYSQTVFVCLGGKDKRASLITIPAPGRGWNYSGVAPILGEHWNRIMRTDGVDVTDASLVQAGPAKEKKTGIHPLETARSVVLVDPAGKPTRVRLSIEMEVNTLATDKARTEPTIHSKSREALPAGLMDIAWRVYLPNNSLRFTLDGLVPGQAYDLYGYAGAQDATSNADGANDGAKFVLAAANVVAGAPSSAETTGGFFASIYTYIPETDRMAPSPAGANWVRLSAVADSQGRIGFSTTRNSNGRHFVNGFQLVPRQKR